MRLALFDLDNTLLFGDSDFEWGRFLADIGVVEVDQYARSNAHFHEDYQAGCLDIHAFSQFSLTPLAENSMDRLLAWRNQFIDERILPLVTKQALQLVRRHIQAGDVPVIITATNSFVTHPIANLFGVTHLIATEPKCVDGHFIAEIDGIPAFREGKVQRLEDWLKKYPQARGESWFYSDSHNDLPLLEWVDHPVAVDPDPQLERLARKKGWPIISLHHESVASGQKRNLRSA